MCYRIHLNALSLLSFSPSPSSLFLTPPPPPPPPHQTNTFQCILASDGFMSYVIFLYADGLIQWTTGSASGGIGGLGGTPAQVGFNAGDMINFASHVDSQTAAIVDIEISSIPEGRSEAGMLVYRVDGSEINSASCVDSADGEYPRERGNAPKAWPSSFPTLPPLTLPFPNNSSSPR